MSLEKRFSPIHKGVWEELAKKVKSQKYEFQGMFKGSQGGVIPI